MSSRLRHQRLIAIVAAVAMVVVLCGYGSHDLGQRANPSSHSDWSMHFTGVAGSAPHPVPVAKPVLAAWRIPAVTTLAPRSLRRLRAHLARAPPFPHSTGC